MTVTLPTPDVAATLRARAKTYTADARQLQRMADDLGDAPTWDRWMAAAYKIVAGELRRVAAELDGRDR